MISALVRNERQHLLANLAFSRMTGTTPRSMSNVCHAIASKLINDPPERYRPIRDAEISSETGLSANVVGRARKALETLRITKEGKLGTSINWARLGDFQKPPKEGRK